MSEDRKKIRRLVMNLLEQRPFFGHVLAVCTWSFEKDLPAPAGMIVRESLCIVINPDEFFEYKEADQRYILMHEIAHFLFKHPWRARNAGADRSHMINNIAMDLATNSFLSDACHIHEPEFVLMPSQFKLDKNKTYEWYLSNLPTKKIKVKVKGDGKGDPSKGGSQTDEEFEVEVPEHFWKVDVPEIEAEGLARNLFEGACKMAGTAPSGALRDLYKTTADVDWKDQFITYAQSSEQSEDWRFCKRHTSRRYSIPPGAKHDYQGEVHIMVDTSGSMSNKEIGACFSIIHKLHLMGYRIWVHEVDAALHDSYIYTGTPPKVHGGGGTMFREAIVKVQEGFPEMQEVIILTDGYIFDVSGGIPAGLKSVLIVLTEDSHANLPDWATTLRMRGVNK